MSSREWVVSSCTNPIRFDLSDFLLSKVALMELENPRLKIQVFMTGILNIIHCLGTYMLVA